MSTVPVPVGAVLFDDAQHIVGTNRTITSLEGGWASVAGAPADRILSIHDLPTDVLWLSNLSHSAYMQAGVNRLPHLRSDTWLRTTVQHLITELGIGAGSQSLSTTASVLAAVAQRTANVVRTRFGATLNSPTVNGDVARAVGARASTIPDAYYPLFEPVAEHRFVSVIATTNYGNALPTVTVRPNRLLHAQQVLATPVPVDTSWELEATVSSDRNDRWLESITTPFLVKATVANVRPMMGDVLSWGSGAKAMRNWLTDHEWRSVRQFADVTVHSALICHEPANVLPQAALLPQGPFAELSMTLGLAAEQLWTAMTIKRAYGGHVSRYSAASAWLRAKERMSMFSYAQQLSARGVTVLGYGTGSVVLSYPENGLRRVLDVATDLGLMPPAAKFAEAGQRK